MVSLSIRIPGLIRVRGKLRNPTNVVTKYISAAEFLSVSSVGHPVGIGIDGTNFNWRHTLNFKLRNNWFGYDNELGATRVEVVPILVM